MIAEAIVTYVADKIAGQIIEDKVKQIYHKVNPPVDYKSRLCKCIAGTIKDYERTNPTTKYPEKKFPFYHSQLLFDLLSRYILFENGSVELLEEQFEQNPNIIKPSAEELNRFYTLFLEKVNADDVLKAKFIDENYKEKIFSNATKLDKVLRKLDAIEKNTERILDKISEPTLQPSLSKELTAQLPLLSSEKIVRRDSDLEDIRGRLVANKQVVLVNGMGGIGKTTLAQMYMTHYCESYKHLAWITTGSGDFLTDLIQAAGLKESLHVRTIEGKTPQDYFNEVIIALKGISHKDNEQSLIVIDNTEEDILQYSDYLPHPPHWHILATSRHKLEAFDVKELDFLNEKQAIELFKLHYRRSKISDDEIGEIVKALDYHTLTIEILAKTAQNDGLDLRQTVSAIAENYPVEVDARHASGKKIDRVTSYLSSIFNLSKLSDDEVWLLKQLCYLPLQYHSYATLETILSAIVIKKKIKLQRVLSSLVVKGWLLYDEATEEYKLHRIIGDIVTHSVEIPFKDVFPLVKSINFLLVIDPQKDNPVDKFPWIIFGSHLLKQLPSSVDSVVAVLQSNLATVLKDFGNYKEAKMLLEKVKIFDEKNFGPDHPTTAASYSNLAAVLQALGDYEGAKGLLEKAKISAEKNFGTEHSTTATYYSNLATVLQDLGDYKGAKGLLEKAKISDEKNFGTEHPNTARRYSNLALVLKDLGDYEGAKELLEKAKISAEKNFGYDHPTTAVRYSNLALVLQSLGDNEGAKELMERAKISDEKNFGPEHPTTALSYSNLAAVLQALGDYEGAKELLEKAIISDEKNFGPDYPNTAIRYSNLAVVLQALGDYEGAKGLLRKAIRVLEKTLGCDHPNTLTAKQNLDFVVGEMEKERLP